MSFPNDLVRAISMALLVVVALLLIVRFPLIGILIVALVALGMWASLRTSTRNPEISSLRSSLQIAWDDIADLLADYDDLLTGTSTEAIADRTLYYPALTEQGSTQPEIEEFQLRAHAARRFVARLDAHLADPALDKTTLERLLSVTDQRAAELAVSWADARRAARRLGPR